jgi:hypothetical protein
MSQRRRKTLTLVADRVFIREFVHLDGRRFVRCRFIECVIHYSGAPAAVSGCTFCPNTRWDFDQDAANTIQTLESLGFRVEQPRPLLSSSPVRDRRPLEDRAHAAAVP